MKPRANPPRDTVLWQERGGQRQPPLHGEIHTDVAVVGGGMMGLMCADALASRGRQVCVIEQAVCGGGASGRSSGFITPDSELELGDIVTRFGAGRGKQVWDFGRGGVDAIRRIILELGLDCDYVPQDSLFVATSPGAAKTTREEYQIQKALGYRPEYYTGAGTSAVVSSPRFHAAVRTTDTFGMDGYRFCQGLRDALTTKGVRIFESTEVMSLAADGVESQAGRVRAGQVVVCADRWLPRLGLAPQEIFQVQTFLGASAPLSAQGVARIFPDGPCMVWETDLIYHYFRLTGERRLLIGGGTLLSTYAGREQHHAEATGQRLTEYLRETFPEVEITLTHAWPGLIGITKDFGPIIGERRGLYFGGGAAGLPWAAAIGRYLADKISVGRGDFDDVFSSERHFPIGRGAGTVMGKRAAFALSHGIVKWRGR